MFFGARKVGQLALSLFVPFSAPNKVIWAGYLLVLGFREFQVSSVLATTSLHGPLSALEVVSLKK